MQKKSRLNWKGQRLHNIEMNKKFIRRQHLCGKIDRNRLKIKKRSFYLFTVKFCQNSANIHEFGTQSAKILPNFLFCHWFSKSATFELFGRKICQLATLVKCTLSVLPVLILGNAMFYASIKITIHWRRFWWLTADILWPQYKFFCDS